MVNNVSFIGTYNKNYVENAIQINFLDTEDIRTKLIGNNIKICVNCIVERQLEICENNWQDIKSSNIDITNNIAKNCSELNIHLIHLSTDYVFDGQTAPYYPSDETNPLQNYGISKLISEKRVISKCKEYTIIRVPVLYTDNINNFEENAVTLIGKKVLNRIETSKEDNYSIRRPNYIPDFCQFLLDMIKEPKLGIFHYCNPHDRITKYEMSTIISNCLHKTNHILPINEEPRDGAERPKDTFLKDTKYNIYDYSFTPIYLGLEKCFRKLSHPQLNVNTNENTSNVFFMIDLDGTLIDTDILHYKGYNAALKEYNVELIYQEYLKIINNKGIDNYLTSNFPNEKDKIKASKNKYIQGVDNISFMKNADSLIKYIDAFNINHVVVTNTSLENVNYFKCKQPLLCKLKNWVTREDYCLPKPDSECYITAKNRFYNNEKSIIGIENSIVGYNSLKHVTDCIYIITDKDDYQYNYFKKADVYLINDFNGVFN